MMSLYYFKPHYVDLQLLTFRQDPSININDDKTDFNSELHWWFLDAYPDSNYIPQPDRLSPDSKVEFTDGFINNLKIWGIDFDELGIDFDKNNVILSFSRKITEMKFNRTDSFPYKVISTVKTKMSKNFEPNTIYVYLIPKYDIREDVRAYTETYLEK